jgi:RNA polymerase sigma-70 factor (ECF subfamily)
MVSSAPRVRLTSCDDDALMALARAGHRDAFAVLVERHAARVASTCVRLVQDQAMGLELAQETWLAVWSERARYRAEGQFRGWLTTLARNACRNQLRSQQARRRHEQQVEPLLPPHDDVERLLAGERERRLQRALGRLPEDMREVLVLRFTDELRYEQIERMLGVSESTLRSRVHHALKRLRRYLEADS